MGLPIHIVTVGTSTPEARRGLEDARARLKASGLEVETSTLPGQPETALGKLVYETPFDMLVMGAYGHSRITACGRPLLAKCIRRRNRAARA